MENNFDLTSFLKKNVLLRENIGGYRDIRPLKKEDLEEDMDNVNALLQKWKDDPSSDPEFKNNTGDYNQAQAAAEDWFDEYESEGRLDDFYGMTVEELIDALELFGEDNAKEVAPILHKMINKSINEEEDPFPSIQKGDSMIFDKGWQYDDDEEDFEDGFKETENEALSKFKTAIASLRQMSFSDEYINDLFSKAFSSTEEDGYEWDRMDDEDDKHPGGYPGMTEGE